MLEFHRRPTTECQVTEWLAIAGPGVVTAPAGGIR